MLCDHLSLMRMKSFFGSFRSFGLDIFCVFSIDRRLPWSCWQQASVHIHPFIGGPLSSALHSSMSFTCSASTSVDSCRQSCCMRLSRQRLVISLYAKMSTFFQFGLFLTFVCSCIVSFSLTGWEVDSDTCKNWVTWAYRLSGCLVPYTCWSICLLSWCMRMWPILVVIFPVKW